MLARIGVTTLKRFKSGIAIVLSFVLLFGIGLPGMKVGEAEAAPPTLNLGDVYYAEGSGPVPLSTNLVLDGEGIYSGGYIEYTLQDAEPGETLTLPTVTAAVNTLGEVSIVGTEVYLGTGSSAKYIGDVRPINDGTKKGFRIEFPDQGVLIDNGGFEAIYEEDFSKPLNWTINRNAVPLGAQATKTQGKPVTSSAIAGTSKHLISGSDYSFVSDFSYTAKDANNVSRDITAWGTEGKEYPLKSGATFNAEVVNQAADGTPFDSNVLRLWFSGNLDRTAGTPYGSTFGPEAYSPIFNAKAGAALAFNWSAKDGGDHYEVYGFLVNKDTGAVTELMYGRGASQEFITSFGRVPADGEYQFRFVAGSYDKTGGLAVGASLYIDDIKVYEDFPDDAVLEKLGALVNYENSDDAATWATEYSDLNRTVTVEVQNINGPTEKDSKNFNIQLEPQLRLEKVSVDASKPTEAILEFNLPVNGALDEDDFIGFTVNGYEVIDVIAPINGNLVTVVLEGPIGPGEIKVLYDGLGNIPSNNAPANLLKPIGEDDFVEEPSDNGVTQLVLEDVIVDGNGSANTAVLDFNKSVAGAGLVEGSKIPGFTIGGKEVTVIAIGVGDGDDEDLSKVVVQIDGAFVSGGAVAYEPESGAGIEENINSNNKLGPIDGDSQPGLIVEEDALVLVSAVVADATPDQVTLTFNRPVDDETIDFSGFTVNGYAIISKLSVNDNDNVIVLQLEEKLGAGGLSVLYNDEAGNVGTYFNPDTNLLGEITDTNQPNTAVNGVVALQLIKVTTVLDEPNQLKLKFNMPISNESLTAEEAIAGFLIGGDKPVNFVSINETGDEIIVSLEAPYEAGDQISYDDTTRTIVDADNANNMLGPIAGSNIPLVSGKLDGIELANGAEAIDLSPAFNPNRNEGYMAVVPNEVTSVSVDPTAYNPDETISKVYLEDQLIEPVDGAWDNVGELKEGPNVITVQVYDNSDPELPIQIEEYTITIVRATGKLASLVPSDGTLDPVFDANSEGVYEIGVNYYVSEIQLTPTAIDPGAKITMSINDGEAIDVESGLASEDLALKIGLNTILVTVTDSNNQIKTYTVEVRRADYPYVPTTPPKQTITIDVVIGGDNAADIVKVDIERTTHPNGRITDQVTFTPEKAKESAEKAAATGETIARMMIPDPDDKVSEIKVDVTKETLKILQENGLDLEIYSDHGIIRLPHSSISGLAESFYFRFVPVRDPALRSEVEERARTEKIVRDMAGDNTIEVVTRPMTIETNLSSRPVTLVLPLRDVTLPSGAKAREKFLNELSIFIEHSDGDKELVKGQPVTMPNGELGLQFGITKFSTFTIVHADSSVESHDKYINGFPDGTFRAERGLTRAQLATILVNLDAAGDVAGVGYPDVSADHWASDAIKRVQAAGLMEGYPDGTFRPERILTRAEMATFAFNFLQLTKANDKLYPDVADSHWAHDIITALTQEGLMGGYPNGTFQPEKDLSRAEAVSLINRLFDRGPLYGVSGSIWSDVSEGHWAFHDIMEASQDHDYVIRAEGGEELASN
ncbi:S-layer homology domain-containing protein [Paenibacillus sp. PAMC21692]|uniref:S-layer homology domain-containing protein n=1 Tax=Paenibacillus sp. PAMC21692 TaxID=2762320 RepID=UPI00164D98D3|nr:S-layer homology domain-containing protein [Paenibacillus sp. PAMC21692]QNK58427.1 S-layer homology domain-containing protein [Paenibacillus sp. PAMC21692]